MNFLENLCGFWLFHFLFPCLKVCLTSMLALYLFDFKVRSGMLFTE